MRKDFEYNRYAKIGESPIKENDKWICACGYMI